ncbi:hypothetical protein B5M09_000841 [Aphanomyces astaci]|uniref:Uncharacterized protein n=1 Tax=Aphanomyces astaci TaxID=112090 RepID=A0A3R7WM94_APHAT|nr:hypothetical protein B5M09_000841 [Aphanomyces astaci]
MLRKKRSSLLLLLLLLFVLILDVDAKGHSSAADDSEKGTIIHRVAGRIVDGRLTSDAVGVLCTSSQAKAERSEFKKTIKQSEDRLRYECEKKKEEGLKNEIDKEIFTKIIKDDRDRYRHQVMELTDRIKRLEREKYDMFMWAKQNQDHCLLEMRKLTRALIKAKKMADEQVGSPLACVSVAFTSMSSRTTARNCMSW